MLPKDDYPLSSQFDAKAKAMRRAMIGPYQIRKRQGRFEIHDGSAVLSRHATYLDAEEAALRRWLHKSRNDDEDVAAPTSGGVGGWGIGWGRARSRGRGASAAY
jgi:hypothetical protein